MKFHRAISTQGCPDATLADAFALARDHGISGLELRVLEGRLDLPAYFTERFGSPEKLAEYTRTQRVAIAVLDTSWKLVGASADGREKLLAFAPWAEALGVRWLRVFDGGDASPGVIAEAAASVAWWREQRHRHNWQVDLAIETHDSLLNASALRAFAAAAPNTALVWDSHHTWKKGGEDPLETWREVRPRAVVVHVKDSVSRPTARHPFTYVLPGTGEFPMAPLRAVLEDEFTGWLCLEWEKIWHPYLAPLPEALRSATERHWW